MNPLWNWLKDTGTQAVLVLVGTFAACVAAFAAIYFGMKSLTKKDLERVEENTAHLEEVRSRITSMEARGQRQEDADVLATLAKSVPIAVSGEADTGMPLAIVLTGKKAGVQFTRVQLIGDSGNVFGMSDCRQTESQFQFTATIDGEAVRRWWIAGAGGQVKNQVLRVWIRFADQNREVHRDMGVTISPGVKRTGNQMVSGGSTLRVEGAV